MRFRLEQPKPSPKMDQIFGAMEQGWPNAKINDPVYDISVLWGLVGNNANIISSGQPFYFCDMPYFGRLDTSKTPTQRDYDNSYWRFCKGGFHDNRKLAVDSSRFERTGIRVEGYRGGEYILVCPSSNTMSRFLHGCTSDQWVEAVSREIRKHTNKEIRVRYKPRKNGTSGPSAADVPLEYDLRGAHAIVVSASLTAIDALQAGVPVFTTAPDHCPAAWCSNTDFSLLDIPHYYDREHLFYNLAWKQYSIEEFRNGTAYEIWNEHLR